MEIISVLGALILVAMVAVLTNKKRHTSALHGIADVYEAMGEALSNSNIDRFVILYTENGGGKPNVGTQLYSSVLYELHDDKIESIKAKWQRMPLDQGYIELLTKIDRDEAGVMMYPEKMPYSLLREIFEKEKVTCGYAFKIRATRTRYYYGSVQTIDETGTIDLTEVKLAAIKIKNIFKNVK